MPPLKGFREAATPGAPAEEEGPPRLKVFARRLASCALQLRLVPSKADRGSNLPHCTAGTAGSTHIFFEWLFVCVFHTRSS